MGFSVLIAEKIYIKKIYRESLIIGIVIISFGLGSMRYAIKEYSEIVEPTRLGVVISEPEERENSLRFIVRSENRQKILVNAPIYSDINYGDMVTYSGEFERPGVIEDKNTGRTFDYGAYLSKDDIFWTLSFADIEVISTDHGNKIKTQLFKLKNKFTDQIKKILSDPHSSLMAGLILAGKDSMPTNILEEFRKAGIIHIVVLSGFNITIIAEFLRRLFQSIFFLFRLNNFSQLASLSSILGVILFVIMAGGEASIVRASIMATIIIVAGLSRNTYSAPRALLLAGFLMLIENPKILVFDPSFQLSFLATSGLIFFAPALENFLYIFTNKFKIREVISQTLSTQLAVLPLLIYSTGEISLVSLPANLLILLIIPATMLFGFIATIISFFSISVAWPLTFITYLLLSWIFVVSSFFGNLSFSTLYLSSIPVWIVIFVYLILFILYFISKSNRKN